MSELPFFEDVLSVGKSQAQTRVVFRAKTHAKNCLLNRALGSYGGPGKTLLSTDFGENFEEKAALTTGLGETINEGACAVFLDEGHVMVAGGLWNNGHEYRTDTFIYDVAGDTWTHGPNMTVGRTGHTCKLITDANGDKKVLAVAGATGHPRGHVIVDSVDIYDVAAETWSAGKHCLLRGCILRLLLQCLEGAIIKALGRKIAS